jgi:hypothetical protein
VITQTLIPELLQFKPKELGEDDSWFGPPGSSVATARRREVLEELIKMISNKIEEEAKQ